MSKSDRLITAGLLYVMRISGWVLFACWAAQGKAIAAAILAAALRP